MKSEKYNIEINFLNRKIPLYVTRKEEERIQKAVKIISTKIDELKNEHKINDQILLAMMCALEMGVELVELQEELGNYSREMKELIQAENLEDYSDLADEEFTVLD